jgi:Predicted Zn-dependent protease (DUF2268)
MRHLALLVVVLVGCASGPAPRRWSLASIEQGRRLRGQAETAAQAKRYEEAARLSVLAAASPGDPKRGDAHYAAACYFALAGQREPALRELARAFEEGWWDVDWTRADPDLASLRAEPAFAEILADAADAAAAKAARQRDPSRVELITEDIPRFWAAYDRAAKAKTRAERIAIYRADYLERATPGLLDYYLAKIGSVESLVDYVDSHRRFYDGVRPQSLQIVAATRHLRDTLRRLQDLYPEAKFPDVTFVIGRMSSGGTVSSNGLLIGAEMYSSTETTPYDELSESSRRIVGRAAELPHVVTHELVHFQQTFGKDQSLLWTSLMEGGAEFVAELVEPAVKKPYFRVYGEAHEAAIWARFAKEMDGTDTKAWIGGNLTATADKPADLGYFVGFEIARRYHAKATDKRAAIRALLRLADPKAILAASGYAP